MQRNRLPTPSTHAINAPSKTNRLIRRARISSGGVRSRSSFFATGRDGCFGTRDVYYGVTGCDADATTHSVERTRLACWFESLAVASHPLHGVAPKQSFVRQFSRTKRLYSKVRDREDALASTRDACATKARRKRTSESIAAADTSTAQEHRAARPRPSPAQERSCHLSGCYRLILEIDAIGLSAGEMQSQDEQWHVVSRSARDSES